MMSQAEIAAVILQLLSETRTYCGVAFGCLHLDPAEQIRFAKGLLRALPGPERYVVELGFERIRAEITARRIAAALATHQTPAVMQ